MSSIEIYNSGNSEPIDLQEYNDGIDAAMKAMDNGEFDLHEDVKKSLLKD